MDVLQCPECELRFRFASELEEHLKLEHPAFHARTQSGESSVSEVHRQQQRRSPRDGDRR